MRRPQATSTPCVRRRRRHCVCRPPATPAPSTHPPLPAAHRPVGKRQPNRVAGRGGGGAGQPAHLPHLHLPAGQPLCGGWVGRGAGRAGQERRGGGGGSGEKTRKAATGAFAPQLHHTNARKTSTRQAGRLGEAHVWPLRAPPLLQAQTISCALSLRCRGWSSLTTTRCRERAAAVDSFSLPHLRM